MVATNTTMRSGSSFLSRLTNLRKCFELPPYCLIVMKMVITTMVMMMTMTMVMTMMMVMMMVVWSPSF